MIACYLAASVTWNRVGQLVTLPAGTRVEALQPDEVDPEQQRLLSRYRDRPIFDGKWAKVPSAVVPAEDLRIIVWPDDSPGPTWTSIPAPLLIDVGEEW